MANMFDKIISDFMKANDGEEDEIIKALKERRDELGENPSEEEVQAAVQECVLGMFSGILDDSDEGDSGLVGDAAEKHDRVVSAVREYLEENQWRHSENKVRDDVTIFELGFNIQNVRLRVKIFVEARPETCRVEAILPIEGDLVYVYPLSELLAKVNYPKRFGSFKYDERDGELAYEHCFLTKRGIDKEELEIYFHAVLSSAVSEYEAIRKCCAGRFKHKEVNEILEKINTLVTEISD